MQSLMSAALPCRAVGTILKFSKRLPLFKYITNTQRTALVGAYNNPILCYAVFAAGS